jgi:hypothetical protein
MIRASSPSGSSKKNTQRLELERDGCSLCVANMGY